MSSLNKVMLIGRLGRDPELRHTQNGMAVANISVATSRSWKDKQSGERKEETEWHRVSLFDRSAEVAGEYLKKGSMVYIEGRLKTRKWEDKDGIERYTTEILADDMRLIGSRVDTVGGDSGEGKPADKPSASARALKRPQVADEYDGDIPF